jgi:methyl-accepting chemotaxis protein
MTFSTRIAVYFMALVATVTAVLLGVMWVQKQQLQQSISDELNQQMHNRTAQILQPIYQLCNVQRSQTVPLLKQDLRNAHYLLSRAGNVSFSNDRVPWSNFTRTGNHAESLELPMLLVGGDWLGVNKDPLTPSPVVDDIKSLSSVDCSIYQRVNRKGDMLRVCTSIVNSKGFRDIGVYVPFRDQTGKINDLIQSVLKGETYIEQASAENHWMTIMGEPIFLKNSSQIVGMLSVERAQRNIADSIRKIILKTPVGKTGYMWVIGAK